LAMGLLWLGMLRSRLVLTPGWRLGAVGFFLVSDSSFSLAMTGRPEPVCILIACAAWLSLTFEHRAARWGSLIACGLATPWAGLQLAVCLAFAGVGAILFYHTRYWREVLALAVGGILGAASLLFFYRHMGVLDAFLLNISPHTSASVLHSKLTGMEHVRQGAFRLGGFTSPSSAWAVLLSLGACLFAFLHKHHQRLAVLNLGFIAGLPLLLITLGVFPHYYGCYWLLPMTVILFALLSAGVMGTALRTTIMAVLLWVSVPMPGAYLWRTLVQGLPAALSDRHERLTLFLKNAVHSNDMAWVDCRIWFATKPLVKGLFSTNWLKQATFGKDRDEMTVVIAASDTSGGFAAYLECLPGKWQSTGEYLEVPNYYRFYRILNTPPPIHYEVFRRIDRS